METIFPDQVFIDCSDCVFFLICGKSLYDTIVTNLKYSL